MTKRQVLSPTRNAKSVSKPKKPNIYVQSGQHGDNHHKKQTIQSGFKDEHTYVQGRSAPKQRNQRNGTVVFFLFVCLDFLQSFHKQKSVKIDGEYVDG